MMHAERGQAMNCNDYTNLILLADSGELSADQRVELDWHLAGCADCRRYRDDLNRLNKVAKPALAGAGPSPWVVRNILAQAHPARRRMWAPSIAGALALAASLLVITLVLPHGNGPAPTDQPGESIEAIHTLLALAEDMPEESSGARQTVKGEEAVRELAAELLRYGGFNDDWSSAHLLL